MDFTLLPGESYVAPATNSDGEVESEFGQPILIGCLDYSDITGTKSDGTKVSPSGPRKTEVIARFQEETSQWTVVHYSNALEGSECDD